ncbi:MAG: glycosyltransferase family 4 protein [Bacteroidetes bacterium]|nr:glycosyltransferase family 4 protein [Bacteroidota bacterium]
MKILILNWQDRLNPLAGGAETHLHEVFKRIVNLGHSVTLFCSKFNGAKKDEVVDGIKVIRKGSRWFFNFRVIWEYLIRFRKNDFDIVVDDLNKIPFFTPLYVKKPLVGVTHHLFRKSIFSETIFPLALYVYLMEFFSLPFYKKKRFIVGSPSTLKELLDNNFVKSKVHHIPYGVDHNIYKPDAENNNSEQLIGMLGRLKKYKSIDILLNAFSKVLIKLPTAKLLIVGEGDDKKRLIEISELLKINNSVYFAGFVSEEEKIKYLQKIKFAVNTSIKEGWGLTVIEANACGVPTISSNVEGLRDAVIDGKTGFLIKYGDINSFADAMIELLENKEKLNQLSINAVEWSKNFDWDKAAFDTLEIFKKVIEEEK